MAMVDIIRKKLSDALSPHSLTVEDESALHHGHAGARAGGESHFRVEIVAAAFEGQSRVARQRLIYAVLKDEMQAQIHALALVTKTPEEAG